jgi:hypothetical protein
LLVVLTGKLRKGALASDKFVGISVGATASANKGRWLFPSLRTVLRPMSENTVNAALRRFRNKDQLSLLGNRQ